MYRKRNQDGDNAEYKNQFPSSPLNEGDSKDHLSYKALKGLPKSSYSIKADPYEAVIPNSIPYNIMGKFLKTVGGSYSGEDNIDGGNVQQYANSSSSKFLKYFDSFLMKLQLNYRYLPCSYGTVPGSALIDENIKAMAEAVSQLQATTFTSLGVHNFAIKTNLNMGSYTRDDRTAAEVSANKPKYGIYTDKTCVLYALSYYYQIFLQEILSVMNAHNSFRFKQGTALRDAWSREVPFLNAFFGLMNKTAFTNLLESINLSFEGEYIDKDFMEQVNLLTYMPSRRSNSITDPTLEITANFSAPSIFMVYLASDIEEQTGVTPVKYQVKSGASAWFDDADLKLTISVSNQTVTSTIWDACSTLKDLLSLESTKVWARSVFTSGGLATTDTMRYNNIKAYFDVIIHCFVQFKPKFSDYRECLDVMTRTGTINWFKGFRPSVTREHDAMLFQNLIVDDVYKMVMSGADTIEFNGATKRWLTFAQWNIYQGVPEYDTKQGGAFITFSAKDLTAIVDPEGLEYMPIMFNVRADGDHDDAIVQGISRDGEVCYVNYQAVTMNNSVVYSRLAPLASQDSLKIRVPSIANHTTYNAFTSAHYSSLYKTLTQVFGMCAIKTTNNGSYDFALDPDLIAIYQIEISDITNAAITYARANAPFRGTTSEQGILGFFGLAK